jgi:hypothetical protein
MTASAATSRLRLTHRLGTGQRRAGAKPLAKGHQPDSQLEKHEKMRAASCSGWSSSRKCPRMVWLRRCATT